MPALPEPTRPGHYRLALVCLGNICRSPMAGVVLGDAVDRAGLAGRVRVRSAGTAEWHVGRGIDPRAGATLLEHGHDPSRHRAQQASPAWLDPGGPDGDDLVLAMDASNLADLRDLTPRGVGAADAAGRPRLRLFRDFDPVDPGGEVPDPYYGGTDGFEEVFAMVERTSATIVATLQRELGS